MRFLQNPSFQPQSTLIAWGKIIQPKTCVLYQRNQHLVVFPLPINASGHFVNVSIPRFASQCRTRERPSNREIARRRQSSDRQLREFGFNHEYVPTASLSSLSPLLHLLFLQRPSKKEKHLSLRPNESWLSLVKQISSRAQKIRTHRY